MTHDFAALRAEEETRDLEIRHPATGETLATITLFHVDAPAPRELRRQQERRRLKNLSTGVRLDPTSIENDALDLITACTKSWKGVTWKGEELVCTPNNVRKFYADVPWVRRLVSEFVNDIGLFLEASELVSGSSSGTTSV